MRILGEAVQCNGGGGTTCHRWWYGKHTKLSPSVMAMNATTDNTDVIRSIQICQRSEKMRQYSRSTMALRLNIRTMLSLSALAPHKQFEHILRIPRSEEQLAAIYDFGVLLRIKPCYFFRAEVHCCPRVIRDLDSNECVCPCGKCYQCKPVIQPQASDSSGAYAHSKPQQEPQRADAIQRPHFA
jgi:hypothetical protein